MRLKYAKIHKDWALPVPVGVGRDGKGGQTDGHKGGNVRILSILGFTCETDPKTNIIKKNCM